MFLLVEDQDEIAAAQRRLLATLREALDQRLTRYIGYQGGNRRAVVSANEKYWHWSMRHVEAKNPRWLNWFGQHPQKSMLDISGEINISLKGQRKAVAGWFGFDTESGATLLFHSGGVGGSTKG